jgi:hypothetical protein
MRHRDHRVLELPAFEKNYMMVVEIEDSAQEVVVAV